MCVKNNAIFENLASKQIYELFIYAFLSIDGLLIVDCLLIKKHIHSKEKLSNNYYIVNGSDDSTHSKWPLQSYCQY